jgi:methylenetetrahydrofolate dehydrogenase (NADP+)/methenyltetrahydrofolate cyclohydrolase
VILVGDDPASQIYVGSKEKACASVGIKSVSHRLPASTTQKDLIALIHKLNKTDDVDGILLQLPIPKHMSRFECIEAIAPEKDVDGLTPTSQGIIAWGQPGLQPCTPSGIMELIRESGIECKGKLAAVLGRSILVGAPTTHMLSHAGATVIGLHSESRNTKELTKMADIVVVATGQRHLVTDEWLKPGAVVIDVGIHRVNGKVSGDVEFETARKVAGSITPVPGGVGPMTIAMLLSNCLLAFERRTKV